MGNYIMDFMPPFAGGVLKNDPQSRAQAVYHQFYRKCKGCNHGAQN